MLAYLLINWRVRRLPRALLSGFSVLHSQPCAAHSGIFCRVWTWGANVILMLESGWTPLCCGGGYRQPLWGVQSSKDIENLYTKLKSPFGVWDILAPILYLVLFFIIRDFKSTNLVLHTCQSPPCLVYFIRRYSHISQILYRHFMWMLSSLLYNKNNRRLKKNIKGKEHAWKQLDKIKNRGYSFKKIQEFLMRSC